MRNKIVVRSAHAVDPSGHGGNRRLAQIIDILGRQADNISVGTDTFGGEPLKNIRWLGIGALSFLTSGYGVAGLKALRNAGIVRDLLKSLLIDRTTIVVFDSWLRAYEPIFDGIRQKGGKVVLFPQNIDSLSPERLDPMSRRVSPDWYQDEVRTLAAADLVCCISREEQWLLSLFGVESSFLPYFPPIAARAMLASIRSGRLRQNNMDRILIMGTASNAPTLQGMRSLVSRAGDIVAAAGGRRVELVGYGTDILKSASLPDQFHVRGAVSQEEMNSCLVNTMVAICFQPGTTGALTRVPELLCAGVPVIANNVAARTYYETPGVSVAEGMDHLIQVISTFSPQSFLPPEQPVQLEEELLRKIGNL